MLKYLQLKIKHQAINRLPCISILYFYDFCDPDGTPVIRIV
jgi:hypothetical protein